MNRIILLLVCVFLLSACAAPDQADVSALQANTTPSPANPATPTNSPFPTLTEALPPTSTFTQKPPATEAATVTPTPTSTIQVCTNQAQFVRHLSVSDNTKLQPGVYFAKVWRIKNIGTCTWTTDYTFVFQSGASFNSTSETPLNHEVKPGETIDIQVALVTPMQPDTYTGNWMFKDPSGNMFGAGDAANQPFSAIVVVEPIKVNERRETFACG